jgi:hypothetical protein
MIQRLENGQLPQWIAKQQRLETIKKVARAKAKDKPKKPRRANAYSKKQFAPMAKFMFYYAEPLSKIATVVGHERRERPEIKCR